MTRKRHTRLSAGLTLAALAVGAAIYTAGTRGRARLAAAVARADASDPDWRFANTLAAHNAAVAPPESNAAGVALAALALDTGSLRAWQIHQEQSPEPPTNRRMSADDLRAAEAAHAGCRPAILAARRVVDFPGGGLAFNVTGPDPYTDFLNDAQGLARAGHLLALDARVLAHRGDLAGALDACAALLHLAEVGVGAEPSVYGQHVGGALAAVAVTEIERSLAWNAAGEAQLARLQEAIRRERLAPRLRHSWRGERAMHLAFLDALEAGAVVPLRYRAGAGARPPAGPVDRLRAWSWRGELTEARAFALEDYEALMAAAELPDPERAEAVAARRAVAPPNRLAGMYRPPFDQSEARAAANRARLACAEVAIACERFRLRAGRFPALLAGIPADILASAPSDPATGGPLGYRVTAEGAEVSAATPDGASAPATRFRLWNPGLRRLPRVD